MIADPASRRKGIGREAVLLLMRYVCDHVPVDTFVVKVDDDNEASLRLFERNLGFTRHKHLTVFAQTELRLPAAATRTAALACQQARELTLPSRADAVVAEAELAPS